MKTFTNILYLLLFLAAVFAVTFFLPSWVVDGLIILLLMTLLLAVSSFIKRDNNGKEN